MTYKRMNISRKQGFPVKIWENAGSTGNHTWIGIPTEYNVYKFLSLRLETWGDFILPQSSFNQLETVGHVMGWLNYWSNHQPSLKIGNFYIFFNYFNGIRGKVSLESRIHAENSRHIRVWDFKHCFLWTLLKSVGMGAQGQRDNHESHEGEKWCYNKFPLIYEVRRGLWWPKCIMCIERTSRRQERNSPDFSLPKTNEIKQSQLMSEVGIPMLSQKYIHIEST